MRATISDRLTLIVSISLVECEETFTESDRFRPVLNASLYLSFVKLLDMQHRKRHTWNPLTGSSDAPWYHLIAEHRRRSSHL